MSAIERYLDEMFDRLAGTGAAGRRLLAETEDHLRSAAAEGAVRGLPVQRAEQEAVERFGPPARIAGQVRRVRGGDPWPLLASAAWLFGGLALVALAVAYLGGALSMAILLKVDPPAAVACVMPSRPLDPSCGNATERVWYDLIAGLLVALLAVLVLAGRRLVVRRGLVSTLRRTPPQVAALLGGLALTFVVMPDMLNLVALPSQFTPLPHVYIPGAAVTALLALVAGVWGRSGRAAQKRPDTQPDQGPRC